MFKQVFCYFLLILIQGCVSRPNHDLWPTDLPPREIFIEACVNNSNSCATPELTNKHLIWVKRFYHGSILYPTGWLEMTDMLTASLQETIDKTTTRERLDKLGLKIVLEWAKDNNERLINSQLIAVWGQALRTSAEKGEQIQFITSIEQDVELILASQLKPEEITVERYYPPEVYDNF